MNKYFNKQIVTLLTSCILASCANQEIGSDGQDREAARSHADCIFRSSIRGYSVLDESNLIVESSRSRHYHVTLRRRAYGLRSSWSIGFESATGRICAGFGEVVFNGDFARESIRIASVRELSQEEHEHLLIQYGKMKPEIETLPVPREVEGADIEELDTGATDDPSGD